MLVLYIFCLSHVFLPPLTQSQPTVNLRIWLPSLLPCHTSAYSWVKSFHIHMANLSNCHKEEIITFSLKPNKAHQSCVLCIIVNIVTSNQFILLVKTVFSWQVKDLWKQYICASYLSTHRHKEAEYIRNKKYVSLYNGPIVCSTREGLCHNIWRWMCFSCSPAFIIKYLMQIL